MACLQASVEQDDPWNWGVDKVVATLCDLNGTLLRGVDPLSIPDPAFLEKALRENAVNGPTLLTELSHPAMRDDLGLKPLGHRSTVTHLIMDLRRQSPRYLDYLQKTNEITYPSNNGVISTAARNWRYITPLMSPIQHVPREASVSSSCRHEPAGMLLIQNQSVSDHHLQAEHELPYELTKINAHQNSTADQVVQDTQHVSAATDRRSETIVIDENGRKRRRLVLAPVTTGDVRKDESAYPENSFDIASMEQAHDLMRSTANNTPKSRETRSIALGDVHEAGTVVIDDHGRKRLRPILVTQTGYGNGINVAKGSVLENSKGFSVQVATSSPNSSTFEQSLCKKNAQNSHQIYMGPESLPVDQIFYGNTEMGQELNLDVNFGENTLSNDADDSDDFAFFSTQFGNGQRRYVNARIKHFLRSKKSRIVNRNGRKMVVHVPYPDSFGKKHDPLSVTVFAMSSGRILASRMDRSFWLGNEFFASENEGLFGTAQLSNNALPHSSHGGDWDYLRKWQYQAGEQEVLPVYGDSGSENEYDLDTWREMEEEGGKIARPLGRSKRKTIDSQEIQLAIDEAVEQTKQRWTLHEMPKLLPRAWKIWIKPRRDGTFRQQIERWTCEIERLEVRLSTLRKEIMGEDWFSAKEVKKQCKSMEQSIYDREGRKWRVSTVKQKSAPQKLPRACKTTKKKPKDVQVPLNTSGGNLTSEVSVPESSDNDLADFIIEDEEVNEGLDENEDRMFEDSEPEEPFNIHRLLVDDSSSESEDIKMETNKSQAASLARKKHPNSHTKPRLPEKITVIDLTQHPESSDVEAPFPGSRQNSANQTAPLYASSDEDPFRRARKKPAAFKVPPTASDVIQIDSDSSAYSTAKENALSPSPLDLPDFVEVEKMRDLNADLLVERKDRKRLLIWVIDHSPASRRVKIADLVGKIPFKEMKNLVWLAFKAYSGGNPKIRGLDKEDSDAWMLLAAWYVCWTIPVRVNHYSGISRAHLHAAEADHKGFSPFVEFLDQCLRHYELADTVKSESNGAKPKKSQKRELREESDDLPETTPHKKRKYLVPESQEAISLRVNAQQRVRERDARQQNLKQRFREMGANDEDSSTVVVNTGKLDDQSFIYINPKIGSRMQPHQKEGVQFMWREIVTDHQGCLLAQTMGLGKTMQVITLLVTIAEAAKSPEENIRNQIPQDLRESRTLILCPPGLIENWWEEFLMWTPLPWTNNIGELRKVTAVIKPIERLYEIEKWRDEGGVLIMGFHTFRDLVNNNANKRGERALNEQQHQMIEDALLERPNIIVADEAHAVKTVSSGINLAISRLKSTNRIALTGSPLSNNLEEYHSLIDWIAPNYLGTRVEFKANYAEQIQEGLYQDSTQSQYRQSLKLLEVLKIELQPKVHRADISVLRGSLKEKHEFVIRVPLTVLQEKIYGIFVDSMLSAIADDEPGAARMWAWLSTLRLLCNHPKCFQYKLLAGSPPPVAVNHANPTKNKGKRPTEVSAGLDALDEIDVLVDAPISELGISQSMAEKQLAPFKDLTEAHDSISLSNKMQILMDIVQFSKEVRDKVLVFSHSLHTLDYVEDQMNMTATRYSRIDGKVRPTERQQISKDFNGGPLEVCLVSTRAGGQGLNLHGANRVIILDDHFNPMYEEQAVGRAYRIGQTKPVFVYHLMIGGTFEELIHNQSVFKQQLARRVVDKKNPARRALKKIGEYIFPPKKVKQQDLERFFGKDPVVLDRILDAHKG